MLLIPNKLISGTRIGPDHEVIVVLDRALASLQGARNGGQVTPPWGQPGIDSDIGNALYAEWDLEVGGPDENPGFEPRPGDTYTLTPLPGENGRKVVLRPVAQPTCEEGLGLDLWSIPACQIRVLT
jgi:hypothetical protein